MAILGSTAIVGDAEALGWPTDISLYIHSRNLRLRGGMEKTSAKYMNPVPSICCIPERMTQGPLKAAEF